MLLDSGWFKTLTAGLPARAVVSPLSRYERRRPWPWRWRCLCACVPVCTSGQHRGKRRICVPVRGCWVLVRLNLASISPQSRLNFASISPQPRLPSLPSLPCSCLETATRALKDLPFTATHVEENVRETLGEDTCDARRSASDPKPGDKEKLQGVCKFEQVRGVGGAAGRRVV